MQISPTGDDLPISPTSPFDKHPMFEKPLTPSDVGKLNRLVIPKQFAEKYFPISSDSSAGTLLAFEDEAGKSWRFRYSYWNSSQSYVLTKGWSRYVKEKCLDAGDVVVFERHREDADRFFIAWRRRGVGCYNAQPSGMAHDSGGVGPAFIEQRRRRLLAEEEETNRQVNNNSPRLVRLFGVNFECEQMNNSQSSTATTSFHPPSSSSSSSYQLQQQQQEAYYRNYFNHMGHHLPPNHYHHVEMEFTQGGAMKQMGSYLGL